MFCAGIQIKMYLYFDISISKTKTLYIDRVFVSLSLFFYILYNNTLEMETNSGS